MKSKFKRFFFYLWSHKWLLALIVVVLIGGVWYAAAKSKKTTYQFVTVTTGSITETVSVTGNTTSTQSVSLAFQNGGSIASVAADLGDQVAAGETIATIDTSGLRAQLQQAEANVDSQNAQLQQLMAGATAQAIAVSQTALATANQNLASTYSSVTNTLIDAKTKSLDAVANQLALFFSDAQSSNPQLTFTINDSQLLSDIETSRGQAGATLSAWTDKLAGLSASSAGPLLDSAIENAQTYLVQIQNFMQEAGQALVDADSLPAATVATYQTDVAAGSSEVNTALTEINTLAQTIAAQKAAIAQAEAQLNVTVASSTPEAIAIQQAQVEQATANAQNIQVQIQEDSIVSPIDGIVTTQGAKVGQIASPGVPLVTILGTGGFLVDADVSEVDIGKVAVGNPVSMTFDAFPGETFNGSVSYINPAETNNDGVVDYDVKISFAKMDSRIKSGLTVNCNILTETDANALILPQYAVLQNDQGTFVEVLNGSTVTQVPVTLGIQDMSGNVEILSGVTAGEHVINIGLK